MFNLASRPAWAERKFTRLLLPLLFSLSLSSQNAGGNNYYSCGQMISAKWRTNDVDSPAPRIRRILVQLAAPVTSLIATLLSRTDLPGIATNHRELVIRCVICASLCPCFSLSMWKPNGPNSPTYIHTIFCSSNRKQAWSIQCCVNHTRYFEIFFTARKYGRYPTDGG